MSAWSSGDWTFWIWGARCPSCGRFIAAAEPIMHPSGGVAGVRGRCSRHGEVTTHDFEIGDIS